MGVMPCYRNGCDSVMCDRYSHEFGYICNECYDELDMSKPVSALDIDIFMDNKKTSVEAVSVDLNKVFPFKD